MNWLDKPYDRELFEKYQTQLLYLVNDRKTKFPSRFYLRKLLQHSGQSIDKEIVALHPNAFTIYEGRGKYKTCFYGRPEFEIKLKFLAEALKYSVALPFALNGVPLVFGVTTTYNPSASAIDGSVFNNADQTSWANIRAAAGAQKDDTSTTFSPGTWLEATAVSPHFDQMIRNPTLFDTGALPSNANITLATHGIYSTAAFTNGFAAQSYGVVLCAPASNTALAASDYNIASWTMTKQNDTDINVTSMAVNGYNVITLNATGLGNITKAGITKFGFVLASDRDNAAVTWVSSAQVTAGVIQSSRGANKPQLIVTYTTTPGGLKGYTFII